MSFIFQAKLIPLAWFKYFSIIEFVTAFLLSLDEKFGGKEWSFVIMCFSVCNVLIHTLAILEMSAFFFFFFLLAIWTLKGELIFIAWKIRLSVKSDCRVKEGNGRRIRSRKAISIKFMKNNVINGNCMLKVAPHKKLGLWRHVDKSALKY